MIIRHLCLRIATLDDMMLLYKWKNEMAVRKSAFKSNIIAFSEHKKWLQDTLENRNKRIYILMMGQNALGQVRIDIEKDTGIIDYSIDKIYRGNGLGKIILQLLEQKILSEKFCNILIGYVKKENIISNKVFQSLDYVIEENEKTFLYRKNLF